MAWDGVRIDLTDCTFKFAVRIIELCRFVEKQSGVTRRLAGQLFDAGTSVGANVEEAQGAQSRRDFIHKNNIALKEARETIYWLRLLSASECVSGKHLVSLLAESREIAAILGKIVVTAKANKARITRK